VLETAQSMPQQKHIKKTEIKQVLHMVIIVILSFGQMQYTLMAYRMKEAGRPLVSNCYMCFVVLFN
jgi:hypothetical protein